MHGLVQISYFLLTEGLCQAGGRRLKGKIEGRQQQVDNEGGGEIAGEKINIKRKKLGQKEQVENENQQTIEGKKYQKVVRVGARGEKMIRGSIYEENVQVKRYALEKGEKKQPQIQGRSETDVSTDPIYMYGCTIYGNAGPRMSLNECYINWVVRN